MDYGPGDGAAVGLTITIIAITYVFLVVAVVLVAYVLVAIGYMRLFRKVGIDTWIAWVPYYNTWKVLELGSQPAWMVFIALVPGGGIVLLVFLALAQHRIGISFGKDAAWVVLAVFLPWLWGMLLGRDEEVYDPSRLEAAGYPPPNAGYASVPPRPVF